MARDQFSRRYCSLYLGKRVAKEDSSVKGVWLSSLVNGSIFHYSQNLASRVERTGGSDERGWYVVYVVCVPWLGLSVSFIFVDCLGGDFCFLSHPWCWSWSL